MGQEQTFSPARHQVRTAPQSGHFRQRHLSPLKTNSRHSRRLFKVELIALIADAMSALLTKRPRSCGTAICREGPILLQKSLASHVMAARQLGRALSAAPWERRDWGPYRDAFATSATE